MRLILGFLIAFAGINLPTPIFAADTGLDVNDVAVLFPIDGLHKPVPFIGLDDSNILSPTVMGDLLRRSEELMISAPQTSSIAQASDWNIVAFRYDPCAPEEAANAIEPCLSELRLIAQPRARFSPADSALHLIYQLKVGQPSAGDPILQDLLALKASAEALLGETSSGKPLGVHPLLLSAFKAKRDDVPALYAAFVRKYARAETLKKMTMMGLRSGAPTDWIFFGGDVKEGHWAQTPIPNVNVKSGAGLELIIQGPTKSFEGTAIDPALSLADYFALAPDKIDAAIPSLDKTLHSLENPALSDRNNSDCVSCHAATSIRLSSDNAFARFVEGITAKVPAGITGFPAPASLQNHPLHWNMRSFGYFGLVPTVNMRSVHEAARSAETVNAILNRAAPGPDCSLVEDKVMSCFFESSVAFAAKTTAEECLSICLVNAATHKRQ